MTEQQELSFGELAAFEVQRDHLLVAATHCPVLGIPLVRRPGQGGSDDTPSLDRVESHLGYVIGNVRVISWRANKIKGDATLDELRAVVRYWEDHIRTAIYD